MNLFNRNQLLHLALGIGIGYSVSGCAKSAEAQLSVTPAVPKPVLKPLATPARQARRIVKTAQDPEAQTINKEAQDTTIEDILKQGGPADGNLGKRVAPFETNTWRVKCTLASIQLMKDGDFYLVMKGDKGGETVVEVPDPNACAGSPLESEIAAARKELEARYHPSRDLKPLNDRATVSGVGFLGWGAGPKKGSKGHLGPRLMPGTGFQFGN